MSAINETKRALQTDTVLVRVVMYTQHFKIIGNLHLPPNGRITDYLNRTLGGPDKDTFLAITQAECFSITDGKVMHISEFMTVHKGHIHIVFPYKQERRET
jgi:hypothetical protein